MAEKSVKTTQSEKSKVAAPAPKSQAPAKPRRFLNMPAPAKTTEKTPTRQPNRLQKWFRETVGELRKVSWPTPKEAWKLTKIVLAVMVAVAIFLGALDWIFSQLITLLVA